MPRAHEIAGSNPAVLTYCGGSRAGTGRRLLTAPTQVRFLPPQLCALGRAAEVPGFNLARRVRFPQGTLGDRLTAGCRALNPVMQVQVLLPEPLQLMRGRLTGRTGRSERSGVGSIPAPATNKPEVIRPDEEPVSKTGAVTPLWVRVPRLPLRNTLVPWSSGNDSWPTPRQRRFKSVRDYLQQHVLAEQPGVLATLSRWRSSVQIRPGTL